MSFGDFLDRNSGGARVVTDLPYNMPVGAIAQPRLVAPSVLARSSKMFNSPGLSLTLVYISCPIPLISACRQLFSRFDVVKNLGCFVAFCFRLVAALEDRWMARFLVVVVR